MGNTPGRIRQVMPLLSDNFADPLILPFFLEGPSRRMRCTYSSLDIEKSRIVFVLS